MTREAIGDRLERSIEQRAEPPEAPPPAPRRRLRRTIFWLAMACLQTAALASLWALQRLAIRLTRWFAVITSQLAGNALGKIAPGGGALGGALQYRLLVEAGTDRGRAATGITVSNLLTFAV